MRTQICLLGLVSMGIALIFTPFLGVEFPEKGGTLYPIWLGSTKLFALPATLLLLGFRKSLMIRLMNLSWGLWVGATAAGTLVLNQPPLSFRASIGVCAVALVCFGLVLFSYAEIYSQKKRPIE